jgi:hypothetical protein
MNVRRHLKRLFGRILTPWYISTLVWIITDTVEVIFLGIALSVVLAIATPFLETATEMVAELLAKHQVRHKTALLKHFVPFINAYKAAVTKYPPALLPPPLWHSLSAQLDIFAHHFRTLKGQKAQAYLTTYDLVLACTVQQDDFEHWDLDACREFVQILLSELSAQALPSWRLLLKRFSLRHSTAEWQRALATAERDLEQVIQRALCQSQLVALTQNVPEVRQRLCALLKLEPFHRQAALQTYLSAPRFHCSLHDVADTVAYLRHDAVAQAFLAVLENGEKI